MDDLINYIDQPPKNTFELIEKINKLQQLLNTNLELLCSVNDKNIFNGVRTIENIDIIYENIICTTYFTSKQDPQRKIQVDENDIKYIEPWYYSMIKNNLAGIVFYDNLSLNFINKYQTEKIKFVKCTLGNYSLNDERFIIYYMFFLRHKTKNILLTDGSDVTINKDPFSFIETKSKTTLFVGRDRCNKIYHSKWDVNGAERLSNAIQQKLPNNYYNMAAYNAGIIGGNYFTTMYFLRQITKYFLKANNNLNNNMAAMHFVIYYYFFPNCRRNLKAKLYNIMDIERKQKLMAIFNKIRLRFLIYQHINYVRDSVAVSEFIYSGYPLNSMYYKYEKESKAYITHK